MPPSRRSRASHRSKEPEVATPGVVSALREDARRQDGARVFVSVGGVRVGAVPPDVVAALGLRRGAMLDERGLARLTAAARRTACYDKAVEALARRARSRGDLERWLRDRGFEADEVRQATERLGELGMLDDEAFARSFARSRAGRGQGRRRIAAELARRGVDRSVADRVLDELAADLDVSEPEAMRALAERRARTLRSLEPAVAERRLFGWLVRRGFDARESRTVARAAIRLNC